MHTLEVSVPHVIVFETTPRWTPELQRQFASEQLHIRMLTTVNDARSAIAHQSAAAIVLALDDAERECLAVLTERLSARIPTPVIVIGSRRSADLECALRELGATQFLTERPGGHELALVCRRLLQRSESWLETGF